VLYSLLKQPFPDLGTADDGPGSPVGAWGRKPKGQYTFQEIGS